jgi:hypothetical protein
MEDVRQLSFVDEGETTGESLLYGGEGVRSTKKQRRTLDPLLNTGHSRAQSQSPPCYTILDYPQHATQQRIVSRVLLPTSVGTIIAPYPLGPKVDEAVAVQHMQSSVDGFVRQALDCAVFS